MSNSEWMSIVGSMYINQQFGKSVGTGCCCKCNNMFSSVMSDALYADQIGQGSNAKYPEPDVDMNEIFERASKTYNVPVNLLKALGYEESGFDPNAVSSAGAMGIMQLMPETAQSLGVTDPFDAEQNIMGGAKLLSENLELYNGNVDLALAAYSAGRGSVEKYGGVPPFEETQNAIRKVKNFMGMDLDAPMVSVSGTGNYQEKSGCQCCGGNSLSAMSQENSLYMGELLKMLLLNNSGLFGSGNSNGWL